MHSNSSSSLDSQTRRSNGEFGPSIHAPGEVDLDVEVALPQRSAEEERFLEYAKVLRQAEKDARRRTASPLELAQFEALWVLFRVLC